MNEITKNSFTLSEPMVGILRSQKVVHLLSDLRSISHIPILFYTAGEVSEIKASESVSLLSEMEQPLICDPTIAHQLHEKANRFPSIHEETSSIYYCTRKYNDNIACILGPLSYSILSKSELHSYMKSHQMHDFQNYHMHSASPQEANALMTLIDYIILGAFEPENILPNPILSEDALSEDEIHDSQSMYIRQDYRLSSQQHLPYLYEQRMYEYVREGDLESLENLISDQMTISGYSHGKVAHDDLKQNEYLIVSQIKLYTRAAIEGGVNPYDAYDISDLLLQKLSAKTSFENFNKVMHECNRAFTTAVKRARSVTASSIYVEKCKYYISKHLREPFSISDIAEYTGLTPAYLGSLFKEHTSCTLKHYIISERLNAAKNMLKFSDYNISSIAESLCFQNQSHFGMLFKKETGMTPAQYRKVYKPRNF